MNNRLQHSFQVYQSILDNKREPKFQISKESRILDKRIKEVEEILESCELCERRCFVNRNIGEVGFCKATTNWKIFGAFTHMGEEDILVPSATLFMAGCTMRCVYCQNAPESINPDLGNVWTEKEVAKWIENKFDEGCKNVNFVGGEPTPYLYNILKCLKLCNANIPVVWNSNSYYSEKTAKILKDVVDIYLLDFRYFNDKCAIELSLTPNYLETVKRNMLTASEASELLIRVLVLPNHIECCAKPILKWIKENLSENVIVNIMGQYYPFWKANKYPEINRNLMLQEYIEVIKYAQDIELNNIIIQEEYL